MAEGGTQLVQNVKNVYGKNEGKSSFSFPFDMFRTRA